MKVGTKRANNILVPMKSVFDFAHRQEIITDNVMGKIKRLAGSEAPIYESIYVLVWFWKNGNIVIN